MEFGSPWTWYIVKGVFYNEEYSSNGENIERMDKALDRIAKAGGLGEYFPSIPLDARGWERVATNLERLNAEKAHKISDQDRDLVHKVLKEQYEMKACPFCHQILERDNPQ